MTQQKWYYNITIVLISQVFCGIGIKTYHHLTVEKIETFRKCWKFDDLKTFEIKKRK